MADYYVPANGGVHNWAAGAIPGNAALDDLHNAAGNITYRIGAAPQVNAHFNANDPPIVVPVNGVAFQVTNNMTSELKVSG